MLPSAVKYNSSEFSRCLRPVFTWLLVDKFSFRDLQHNTQRLSVWTCRYFILTVFYVEFEVRKGTVNNKNGLNCIIAQVL